MDISSSLGEIVSRAIGFVILIGSGILLSICLISILGYMALDSEYSSNCRGVTGALVQSNSDGEQYCTDLLGMVGLSFLFAAISGISGLVGLIIAGIVISSNPLQSIVIHSVKPVLEQEKKVIQVSQNELMDYEYQQQLQTASTQRPRPPQGFPPPPTL